MLTSPPTQQDQLLQEIHQLRMVNVRLQKKLRHYEEAVKIKYALEQHAIVSITDTRGVITYVNEKFCELSGYSREELVGQTHKIINSNSHSDAFFAELWNTIASGKTWWGEIKNQTKQGAPFWVDMAITPFVDKRGELSQFVAICTDTTAFKVAEEKISELLEETQETNEELRASEEELRQTLEHTIEVNERIAESEEKYRLISESMSDLICLHNLDGTYAYVTQSVKPLLGYEPSQLVGRYPSSLIHPEDFENTVRLAYQQALKGITDTYIQCRIRNQEGRYIWFETFIQPIFNAMGKVINLHTASRDITKRKQAEEERDNFFNHSLDLMVVADLDGRILRVNHSWEETLGFTQKEFKNSLIFDFIHPDDIAATIDLISNELQKGQTTISFENRYRCKDRSYRWLSWNYVPVVADNAVYGFARDITERRQAEETLKDTLNELQKRNHELDNYVYKVSHDLRAPLCSIKGLTNLIQMEDKLETIQSYNQMIEARINKCDQFILSILSHSKMLNSRMEITSIDFKQIIENCFEELKYVTHTERLTHQIFLEPAATFFSDAFRISIILKNFISNAIKYYNPNITGNYVHFRIKLTATEATIRIEDNGIGISEQHLPKLFDMFFRATEKSEGSGLGLYIVKQTIEKIGGTVSVESVFGTGTTFTIVLPNLGGKSI